MSDAAPIVTDRLVVRPFTLDDAGFVLELLNDPSFLQHIGDKGVRTLEDARAYIESGPRASYARHGFGLCAVEPRGGGEALGMCGLLKRDALEHPDVGFAFLPRFRSKGYAFEAAAGVLAHARSALGLRRILAITSPGNTASIELLGRLGFRFERRQFLSPGDEVNVFASDGDAP
jgi:RimJ/RimL family protein N-acetyltransferase